MDSTITKSVIDRVGWRPRPAGQALGVDANRTGAHGTQPSPWRSPGPLPITRASVATVRAAALVRRTPYRRSAGSPSRTRRATADRPSDFQRRASDVHGHRVRRHGRGPPRYAKAQREVEILHVGGIGSSRPPTCSQAMRRNAAAAPAGPVSSGSALSAADVGCPCSLGNPASVGSATRPTLSISVLAGAEQHAGDRADERISPERLHKPLQEVRPGVDVVVHHHDDLPAAGVDGGIARDWIRHVPAQADDVYAWVFA